MPPALGGFFIPSITNLKTIAINQSINQSDATTTNKNALAKGENKPESGANTMPRKSSTQPTIDDSALGHVPDLYERQWKKVYYGLRELLGVSLRRSNENFNWEEFKQQFESVFGSWDERRYTLPQLEAYAQQKFGKSADDLVAFNQRSWQRRRMRQQAAPSDPQFSGVHNFMNASLNVKPPADDPIQPQPQSVISA
jgi:hypothetical protein